MTTGPVATIGIDAFCRALERRSGLYYGPEKAYLFEGRLRDVFAGGAVPGYPELARLLDEGGHAAGRIVEALVTSETFFFRDEGTFAALPQLARLARPDRREPLVVWSIGCATGQEIYSALMALAEAGLDVPREVRAYGVDLSGAALARAREATYTTFEVARGISPSRRERFFEAAGDRWRVVPDLREAPAWLRGNVLDDLPALPRPHLVFCRNILIYFSEANKARVLDALAARLVDSGYLLLGGSEHALASAHLAPVRDVCGTAYRPAG